jgi:hypothetical protein
MDEANHPIHLASRLAIWSNDVSLDDAEAKLLKDAAIRMRALYDSKTLVEQALAEQLRLQYGSEPADLGACIKRLCDMRDYRIVLDKELET